MPRSKRRRIPASLLVMAVSASMALADRGDSPAASHSLGAEEVERLLARPACFDSAPESDAEDIVQDFPVQSNGITLAAQLHWPRGQGPWPAIILVPGGFNETNLIMMGPRHDAPLLAKCGFAAVVFYKRGTGPSGGAYAEATYDDFIADVGNIARQLAQHPNVDPTRIGAKGGSSGGLVASIAAARYQEISFVINTSGPIVPMEEENNYNIEYALRSRGTADSLVEAVMPLWRRHHAAWAHADTTMLEAVAAEILRLKSRYEDLLPTPYNEIFTDSNLVFLWPQFRSASRDYLVELKTMRKKWFSIYGAEDPIVPVTSCVRNIETLMQDSGNELYTVIVLPGVDHSFFKVGTQDQVPVLRVVVNWLAANVGRQ